MSQQVRTEDLPEIVSPKLCAAFFQTHRTTLWRWEKENPNFPKSKRFSARKKGYLRSEIVAYINSL
jgi:predicted DNA-binding transcriptional regulator AlpA